MLFCIATLEGGGAERQAALLARSLAERGWDVRVGLLRGGPNDRYLASTDVRVEKLAHRSHYDPRLLLELRRVARAFRPDIVHTWLGMMDVLGGATALLHGIPWVASERGSVHESTFKERARRRMVAAGADVLVTNSEAGRSYVERHMGGRVPIVLVHSGVPVVELSQTRPIDRAALGVPADAEVTLFAGRFSAEKNVETLVRAVPVIIESRPSAIVICAGVGPLLDEMVQLSRDLGVMERMRFPGYVQDLARWMRSSDVFVSASHYEGRPNAVLEAMAVGVPITASDIPAHRELLDDSTAILFDPTDAKDLARAVVASLSDATLARARADAARLVVSGFDVEVMASRYEEVYRRLLAGRNRGSTRP